MRREREAGRDSEVEMDRVMKNGRKKGRDRVGISGGIDG